MILYLVGLDRQRCETKRRIRQPVGEHLGLGDMREGSAFLVRPVGEWDGGGSRVRVKEADYAEML